MVGAFFGAEDTLAAVTLPFLNQLNPELFQNLKRDRFGYSGFSAILKVGPEPDSATVLEHNSGLPPPDRPPPSVPRMPMNMAGAIAAMVSCRSCLPRAGVIGTQVSGLF
jgi:hypothetical protein